MKKIALVVFKYPLGTSLLLINSAQKLAQSGYEVHVFVDTASYEQLEVTFGSQSVIIHCIEQTVHDIDFARTHARMPKASGRTVLNAVRKRTADSPLGVFYRKFIYRGPLHRAFSLLRYRIFYTHDLTQPPISTIEDYTARFFPELVGFAAEVARQVDEASVCIIGVEPLGLIASTLVTHNLPASQQMPTIYFNMELLMERECREMYELILKSLERACNRTCYLTIVQDRQRAQYLIEDNQLRGDSVICVPVAALGASYAQRNNVLRRKFNIEANKSILLYTGNIVEWAMCLEMAQAAQRWKEDKVLVMHSWVTDMDTYPYIREVLELTSTKKVYLSLERLSDSELMELLSSADIGLAFYRNEGKNFYEIGHASNKLVQYLKVGLPVITVDFPSFRDVIDKYGCGAYTSDPAGIEALSDVLLAQYQLFRRNAFKCYEQEYQFDRHFAPVLSEIAKLSTRAAGESS